MNSIVLLALLGVALGCQGCLAHTTCYNEMYTTHLDVAADLITKAKTYYSAIDALPMDCSDILKAGNNESGTYSVWPRNRIMEDGHLDVYCDMDTDGGGWTVIQRRGNYSRRGDFFYKDWASYKAGFGNVERDFWLGNDNIYALSNQRRYSIRIDLWDLNQDQAHAVYDTFFVDGEANKYTLHIDDYSGTAGDSMETHNNQSFSTKDQDNDNYDGSCAEHYKGGWWYNSCHDANLNGLVLQGEQQADSEGIEWRSWKGYQESLDATEMKIRPVGFKSPCTNEA